MMQQRSYFACKFAFHQTHLRERASGHFFGFLPETDAFFLNQRGSFDLIMNLFRRSLSRERKASRDNSNKQHNQTFEPTRQYHESHSSLRQTRSSDTKKANAMNNQVLQHLKTASAKYAESAKEDILSALQQFKDLSPGVENFLFPDGKRRQAFKLSGTIPVIYKGSTYNIPICVYLYDTHPYYAPISYVRPTSAMVIKESEHVNKEGRVFLPYLNEWRFPGYDLSGLLQMMAMVFQDRCPVFAKSSATAASSGANSGTATPTNSTGSGANSGSQPPYPTTTPYPTSNPQMPSPYAAPSANSTPYPIHAPYPMPSTGANTQYNPYMNLPYGTGSGYPGMNSASSSAAMPTPSTATSTSAGYGQSDAIRQSLISAVEDKIRKKLQEKLGTSQAELASIRQTQGDLRGGQQKLKTMAEELEKQQKHLELFVCQYQDKKGELEKALADSQVDTSKGLAIDQVIDAATPLHRQLLQNYAADLACDDVIYSLGQALKKGTINVSEYLKRVRDISRQQFIHRATMQKCRRTAGLAI